MMFRLIAAALLALTLSGPVHAQDPRSAGIEQTIQGQIDAFLVDDFPKAFGYASPTIKQLFKTPQRFGSMVRNGYPMVWRPTDVEFLELRTQGPFLFQKVLVRDAQGAPHVLEYNMIETDQGWQIDGVQLLSAPPVGA